MLIYAFAQLQFDEALPNMNTTEEALPSSDELVDIAESDIFNFISSVSFH